MAIRKRAAALGFAAGLAVLAAGCGSSSSGPSSSSAASSSAPTSTSAAGSSGTKPASGAPIDIAVDVNIKSLVVAGFTNIPVGATLAAQEVNAAGGIDGRPIKIISCDTKYTPAGDVSCARQAVAAKAIAALTSLTGQEPALGVYAAGHITEIPMVGGSTSDYGSGVPQAKGTVYEDNGGGPGSFLSVPFWMKQHGKSKLALAAVDVPGALSMAPIIDAAAKKAGVQFLGTVKLPLQPGDFSSEAEQLKGMGADTVVFAAGSPQTVPLIKAAWSIGFKPVWAKDCSEWWTSDNQQLGTLQSPVLTACAWPPSNETSVPVVNHLDSLLKSAGELNSTNEDITTMAAYATVKTIAEIANAGHATTAPELSAAMAKSGPVDVVGLYHWTPSAPGIAGMPLMNASTTWWTEAVNSPEPKPLPGPAFDLVSAWGKS